MAIKLANRASERLDWHSLRQATAGTTAALAAGSGRADSAEDLAFATLQSGYRDHGGILQGESLAGCLSRAGRGGYVELARRIVAGELFSVRWRGAFWLPMFQFHPIELTPRTEPSKVLAELHGVLNGWQLARWHISVRGDLRGLRPLDLLESDLDAVLAAARADRLALAT
jgi:hypothetical protein